MTRAETAAAGFSAQGPGLSARALSALKASLVAAVIAALLGAALLAYQRAGGWFLEAPDRWLYDYRHVYFAKQPPTARGDIVLVKVSDRSLANYTAQQPVDRALLAAVVTTLANQGARVIGLGFAFDRATDPAKDDALAAAIRAHKDRVVVGVLDARSAATTSAESHKRAMEFQRTFLEKAGTPRVGHLYFDRKRGGIGQPDLAVRWMARRSGRLGEIPESFAEAVLAVGGEQVPDIGQGRVVPESEVGPLIAWLDLNAVDRSATFTSLDVEPLQPGSEATSSPLLPVWGEAITARMVIVGGLFEDRDRHQTPFTVANGARMTGAEVHAHIAAQLKDGRQLHTLSKNQEYALASLIAFAGLLLGYLHRKSGGLWDYPILVGILAVVGSIAFATFNTVLPSDTMFWAAIVTIWLGRNGSRVLAYLYRRFGTASTVV